MKRFLPAIPSHDKLLIARKWCNLRSDETVLGILPSDKEVLMEVALPGFGDEDAAVSAALDAFDHGPWPRMAPYDHARVCERLADAAESGLNRLNIAWL